MGDDYADGFVSGWTQASFMRGDVSKLPARFQRYFVEDWGAPPQSMIDEAGAQGFLKRKKKGSRAKRKGKLSAYNKFVKANASKPRFKYKSGSKKGRINMKKIAAAWKKTTTYKKSKKK